MQNIKRKCLIILCKQTGYFLSETLTLKMCTALIEKGTKWNQEAQEFKFCLFH